MRSPDRHRRLHFGSHALGGGKERERKGRGSKGRGKHFCCRKKSINQSISDLYNGAIIRREAASRRRRDESRDQLKATENR